MLNIAVDVNTHCLAIEAPLNHHEEIIEEISQRVLGTYRTSHPDILIVGTIEKSATIDECRDLIGNLALKPMEATRRLGVVMRADKLNVQAANSLLKLSEEPPSYAVILFLMEDSRLFLPTLRSRSRLIVIPKDEAVISRPCPQTSQEWVQWLSKTRKAADVDELANELASWSEYAMSVGDVYTAELMERLKNVTTRKNLSIPMLCDVIILMLKEEKNEHILNDIW